MSVLRALAHGFGEEAARLSGLDLLGAIEGANIARDAHDDIKTYPPQAHVPQAAHWTPRQRRYFFAALASGAISVPYARTGKVGASWATRTTRGATSLTVWLESDSPVAPGLMGDSQWWMHAGNWRQGASVWLQHEAEMGAKIETAFAERMGRGL